MIYKDIIHLTFIIFSELHQNRDVPYTPRLLVSPDDHRSSSFQSDQWLQAQLNACSSHSRMNST